MMIPQVQDDIKQDFTIETLPSRTFKMNHDNLTIIGDSQSYHIGVQVYDSANNTVWQREDQPYLPLPDAPGFARAKLNGVNWRTYSTPDGTLIITVGPDTAVRS